MSPKLPADWREMKLGDVYDIAAGGDLNVAEYSPNPDEFYPFPVYSNALKNKGLYGYSQRAKYDEDAITITARGDIGFANHRKTKFVAVGRLLVLKKRIPIFNEFVCEYINHRIRFSKETTGVPQLTAPQASNYRIALPPLPEQKAIADTLQTWDEAIEKIEALIEAKERRFEWLKSQLLSPKFNEANWSLHRLGNFIDEYKEKSFTNGQYPLLTSSCKGIFLQETYFSRQIASKNNIGYRVIRSGDFTFRSMSEDGVFTFNRQRIVRRGLVSPAYSVFSANEHVNGDFLHYLMNSFSFRCTLARRVQGGTRLGLKMRTLMNLNIYLPPLPEQKRIAHILNTARREIDILKQLADRYQTQKRGLMQKLLTGKWRIKN